MRQPEITFYSKCQHHLYWQTKIFFFLCPFVCCMYQNWLRVGRFQFRLYTSALCVLNCLFILYSLYAEIHRHTEEHYQSQQSARYRFHFFLWQFNFFYGYLMKFSIDSMRWQFCMVQSAKVHVFIGFLWLL